MDSIPPNLPQDKDAIVAELAKIKRKLNPLNITTEPLCTKCEERTRYKKGRSTYCQPCHNEHVRDQAKQSYTPEKGRDKNLRRNYSMTLADYELMLFRQGGVCAICGQAPTKENLLVVDHCHASKVVRELLCHRCNVMLGNAQDDTELLKKAIKYLKKHSR